MDVYLENDVNDNKKLLDVPENGDPIYEESLNEDNEFELTLRRIWQEKGDFSKVNSKTLLKDQLNEINNSEGVNEVYEEEDDDDEQQRIQQQEQNQSMQMEDLMKYKQSISFKLGEAQNELGVTLDVINLLLSRYDNEDKQQEQQEQQLPLPKGSIGTTKIERPVTPPFIKTKKSELSIESNTNTLNSISEIFQQSSQQVNDIYEQNNIFWNYIITLSEHNWEIIPVKNYNNPIPINYFSPNDIIDNSPKDVRISYCCDESSAEIKGKSLASFSEDLTINDESNLILPKHSNKRLKISISHGSSIETSYVDNENNDYMEFDNGLDVILEKLKSAQDSAFDQDVFSKILDESNSIPTVITSSEEQLVIELDSQTQLTIELTNDINEREENEMVTQSRKCNLLLIIIKLLHIKHYKQLKVNKNKSFSILKSLLDILHYKQFVKNLKTLFESSANILKSIGLNDVQYCIEDSYETFDNIVEMITSPNLNLSLGSQIHFTYSKL